jgi:hypothetical protein
LRQRITARAPFEGHPMTPFSVLDLAPIPAVAALAMPGML